MTIPTEVSGEMLIAAPERWDEACFAVPALRAILQAGMNTGVLCPQEQVPLWETLPKLAILSYPPGSTPKILAPALTNRWQASIAWHSGLAVEAFTRARIPRRIGPLDKSLKKHLTHPVAEVLSHGPPSHRVRHYLNLVDALGLNSARAEFFAPADLGVQPEPGTVLLCPASDFGGSYEWPLERWQDIGRKLVEREIRVSVAWRPGGSGLEKSLLEVLPADTPFIEITSVAAILPLLAVHQVVVAADGSLPHLAAHVGATCVTLFGPNDPHWKRPLGRRHFVVSRHAECAPCFMAKCPLDGRCQTELETARVWAALSKALGLL